jgi:hypothetical protein
MAALNKYFISKKLRVANHMTEKTGIGNQLAPN